MLTENVANEKPSVDQSSIEHSIDGSILEGGGQILRISVALAGLLGKPLSIDNIRGGRSKPGLLAQHLLAIQLASQITQAKVDGLELRSMNVTLQPSTIKSGFYRGDIETAGSTTLVVQSLLPILIYGPETSQLCLKGGTNAAMAPPVDYYTLVLFPLLRRLLGLELELDLNLRGFYPQGGGEIRVQVTPVAGKLPAFDLTDPGEVQRIFGVAFVAGKYPQHLAEQMAKAAEKEVRKQHPDVVVEIEAFKESRAFGSGASVILIAKTSTGCLYSASSLPRRQNSRIDEAMGIEAAKSLLAQLSHGGAVDEYTQDQLIIFMALGDGESSLLSGPITLHAKTAIHICENMLGVKFTITDLDEPGGKCLIKCQGVGFSKQSQVNKSDYKL